MRFTIDLYRVPPYQLEQLRSGSAGGVDPLADTGTSPINVEPAPHKVSSWPFETPWTISWQALRAVAPIRQRLALAQRGENHANHNCSP